MTSRASIVEVNNNPGSYFVDDPGDKVYVSCPDGELDYFTNDGGLVGYHGGVYSAAIRYGCILQVENCEMWGGCQILYGAKLFLHNVVQRFSESIGVFANVGGQIYGENVGVEYAATDGISSHARGIIKLKDVIVGHCGVASDNQAITCHEDGSIILENIIAHHASGDICATVEMSRLFLSDFDFDSPGGNRHCLETEGEIQGIVKNGILRNAGGNGLYVGPNLQGWGYDRRFLLKNVRFEGNTGYDVSVADDIESDVTLQDCDFTKVDPSAKNFTELRKKTPPLAVSG